VKTLKEKEKAKTLKAKEKAKSLKGGNNDNNIYRDAYTNLFIALKNILEQCRELYKNKNTIDYSFRTKLTAIRQLFEAMTPLVDEFMNFEKDKVSDRTKNVINSLILEIETKIEDLENIVADTTYETDHEE
jgi:hypothetical protein